MSLVLAKLVQPPKQFSKDCEGLCTIGNYFQGCFWKQYWISKLCSTKRMVCHKYSIETPVAYICPSWLPSHYSGLNLLSQRIHFNRHAAPSDLHWPPKASQIDQHYTQSDTSFTLSLKTGDTKSTFTFNLYRYKHQL